jgi:hypothetical protein
MLSTTDKKRIATLLRIKDEDFEAAIKDEKEVALTISATLSVLEEAELTARDANKIIEGKGEGETEAVKKFIKEVGKKMGFEPKGERLGELVTELQAKVNSTGDDKVKTLQDQVNLLTADKETLTTSLTKKDSEYKQARFDSDLIGHFPVSRTKDLTDQERLQLIKSNISFVEEGGVFVAKKGNEILKDKNTHAPLPVNQVITDYFTERSWVDNVAGDKGGRGVGNSMVGSTAGIKNMSQAQAQYLKDNPGGNLISPQFSQYVGAIAKADVQFNMNE